MSAVQAPPPGRSAVLAVWLLVLAPVAVLPGALDRFTFPTVVLAYFGVLCAALAPARGRLPRWAVVVLAVGAGLLALAALTSVSPWASVWGRWPRYEGLVVLPLYVGALWAGARLLGPGAWATGPGRPVDPPASGAGGTGKAAGDRRARSDGPTRVGAGPSLPAHLTAATAVLALLLAAVSLAQAAGLPVLESAVTRPGAQLGNATDQGLVAMIATLLLTPPAVAAARPRRRPTASRSRLAGPLVAHPWLAGPLVAHPWLALAGLVAAVLTVALSGSRAALLGTLLGLAVLAGAAVARRDPAEDRADRTAWVGAGVVGAVVVGLALALASTRDRLTGANAAAPWPRPRPRCCSSCRPPRPSGRSPGRRRTWPAGTSRPRTGPSPRPSGCGRGTRTPR